MFYVIGKIRNESLREPEGNACRQRGGLEGTHQNVANHCRLDFIFLAFLMKNFQIRWKRASWELFETVPRKVVAVRG